MLRVITALANPHRLRVIASLAGGRNYVSQLARDLSMSRPLLHMHLKRLEAAGLIVGRLELGDEGKAMKFYELSEFDLHLTPATITHAVTMTAHGENERTGA